MCTFSPQYVELEKVGDVDEIVEELHAFNENLFGECRLALACM